ncbi:MAG: AAC(3) family N-acetyltransferase [Pseudomonadota bacterium]
MMRPEPAPATRISLREDLLRLGVSAGDLVMLHAAFREIRPVEGGPDTLIDALMDVVGRDGGLVMFVSWDLSPYDAYLAGGPSAEEREEWPAFDPKASAVRATHGGAVGACLARRDGSFRSRNPDRSLVGFGAAVPLLADQPFDHGFGPGSPLERLYQRGAKTLNLGAPLYTATILHYAEYLAGVPGKWVVEYEIPILEDGRKVWRRITQMNRDAFVAGAEGLEPDYLEQVIRAYLATGAHRAGRVGHAQSYLFEMADLVPFAVRYFEERYGSE